MFRFSIEFPVSLIARKVFLMKKSWPTVFVSAVVVMLGMSMPSAADAALPTAFDNRSDATINYDDWDLILSSSVLDTGLSDRRPAGRKGSKVTGSRFKHGNQSVTALEGNRVMFYQFNHEHLDLLLAIRQDLEKVPAFKPLEEFSQNEQLAYWLNLRNVAVMYEIGKAYPIKKLKDLSDGVETTWNDKTMMVGDVPTSIRDIENHVVSNWNDPLVLYGFFTGAVGGPSLQDHAFTGENVRSSLQKSAKEFVNSLRGFRVWSGYGRVSRHYTIGDRYFPDFDADIKDHMMDYANDSVRRGLQKVSTFKPDNYDWHIADLKGGDVYQGSSINTSSGALNFFIEGLDPNSGSFVSFGISSFNDGTFNKSTGALPPQIREFLRSVQERKARQLRSGEVTVEEFIDADTGRINSGRNEDQEKNRELDGSDGVIH